MHIRKSNIEGKDAFEHLSLTSTKLTSAEVRLVGIGIGVGVVRVGAGPICIHSYCYVEAFTNMPAYYYRGLGG